MAETSDLPNPPFESQDEYREWVQMLARNNLARDGSKPLFVAKRAVVSVAYVGDETTLRLSLEPYADDPSTQTRAWPKDILQIKSLDASSKGGTDLQSRTVGLLAEDIQQAMEGMVTCVECGVIPSGDADDLVARPVEDVEVNFNDRAISTDRPPEGAELVCHDCREDA